METSLAVAMGLSNAHKEPMVFDWDKAAKLIKAYGVSSASAGLKDDWEYTGGEIFKDGKPIPEDQTYTYLASTWATPELEINGERIPCYRMKTEVPDWDANTYWPESSLTILNEGK